MTDLIHRYGWDSYADETVDLSDIPLQPARIIEQYSGIYTILSNAGRMTATLSGKFEHSLSTLSDLPTIGDWVMADILPEDKKAVIDHVLPRKSMFSRNKAGGQFRRQIIAANIDMIFIVTGLDENFNIRRIERYLTQIDTKRIIPILIFNKTDLITDSLDIIKAEVDAALRSFRQIYISTITRSGYDELTAVLEKGKTVCFVGSSGVGKSSIINTLLSDEIITTKNVRAKDGKGRHVTSTRNIFLLETGAIVIDTPGMRELSIWSDTANLETTFSDILALEGECRFSDCTHTVEPDCAIQDAISKGILDEARYNNYLKLQKEIIYNKLKQEDSAARNTKRRQKNISRKVRDIKKHRNKNTQ